jgi:hypothetical protein
VISHGLTHPLKHRDLSCTVAPDTVAGERSVGLTLHGKAGAVLHASLTAAEARMIAASLVEYAGYIDPPAPREAVRSTEGP